MRDDDDNFLIQPSALDVLYGREAYHEHQLALIREQIREQINHKNLNKPVRKD